MAECLSAISKYRVPCYLVSFLEGTRSTEDKLLASQAYAKEHGLKEWENARHVILPRYKGFVATVQHIAKHAPHIKYVYDFTLMYPDDLISGWMVFNQFVHRRIKVYIKKYEIAKDLQPIINDKEKMKQWVYDRFLEKEKILNEVEAQGKKPVEKYAKDANTTEVETSWQWPEYIEKQRQDEPMVMADWTYQCWDNVDAFYAEQDKKKSD